MLEKASGRMLAARVSAAVAGGGQVVKGEIVASSEPLCRTLGPKAKCERGWREGNKRKVMER